jgi:hypothetical protein
MSSLRSVAKTAAPVLLALLGAAALAPARTPVARADSAPGVLSPEMVLTVAGVGRKPLSQLMGAKGTAIVFVGTSCPIANGYAPEFAALARAVTPRGGRLILAYPNPDEAADIPLHRKKFGLTETVAVIDEDQALANALKANLTPEVFVFDGAGALRYSGRVDDRYVDRGKPTGSEARTKDLAAAMDAVLAGKPIASTKTQAFGCFIERTRKVASTGPTYARDVAPILNKNCVSCHRSGEIGPMPFQTFEQARRYATNIASVVQRAYMPPWKPVAGHGEFQSERRLTPSEIQTLDAWAKAGTPAGDMTFAPTPPTFTEGWALGKPDLILKMPEAYRVPVSGPDLYRCFVLPTGLTEDKQVVAVEYRPGNKSVVHHIIGYIDTQGQGRKRDAADPGQGYTQFGGPGFMPSGELAGWVPGYTAQPLPDGIARLLPSGSDLVMQVHYHPTGKPELDQGQVGIYFAKKPAKKLLRVLPLIQTKLDIPPGEKSFPVTQNLTVPFDARAVFIVPHMHLLGKTIRVDAAMPDGSQKPMLKIDDWDFNWQDMYTYQTAVALPKGTKLTLTATYDNSKENPRQPRPEPARVTWGEETTDEMCIAFIGFVADNENDPMIKLMDSVLQRRSVPPAKAGTR